MNSDQKTQPLLSSVHATDTRDNAIGPPLTPSDNQLIAFFNQIKSAANTPNNLATDIRTRYPADVTPRLLQHELARVRRLNATRYKFLDSMTDGEMICGRRFRIVELRTMHKCMVTVLLLMAGLGIFFMWSGFSQSHTDNNQGAR